MSADLDALDRGVIEVGQIAAEALARVDALETAVAELIVRVEMTTRAEDIIRRAGLPPIRGRPQPRRRPRRLKAIEGGQQ